MDPWTQDYGQLCEELWLIPGIFDVCGKKHKERDRKEEQIRLGVRDFGLFVCASAEVVKISENLEVKCAIFWTWRLNSNTKPEGGKILEY